jgi:hypothetical protein
MSQRWREVARGEKRRVELEFGIRKNEKYYGTLVGMKEVKRVRVGGTQMTCLEE